MLSRRNAVEPGETLHEGHGILLDKETVRQWMYAAGLWVPRAQRPPKVYQPRNRRACYGELIQIDGSDHRWFEDRAPACTLLVFVDDATSRLMALHFTSRRKRGDDDGWVALESAFSPPARQARRRRVRCAPRSARRWCARSPTPAPSRSASEMKRGDLHCKPVCHPSHASQSKSPRRTPLPQTRWIHRCCLAMNASDNHVQFGTCCACRQRAGDKPS